MKTDLIVVAGVTGDLGGRIASELIQRGASVRGLVRTGTMASKLANLDSSYFETVSVNYEDSAALAKACAGASVIVSALSGLGPVVLDAQTQLLNAAVKVGVKRFIPSDFAIDFTKIPQGSNRNLNLRADFKKIIDEAPIKATSILNGAFTDMLTGLAPFILFRWKRILCWGDPSQLMDWTTIADTAAYTAQAALDDDTPRFLRIAGDQLSAQTMCSMMSEITGERYRIFRPGGLGMLNFMIRMTRSFTASSNDVYPVWQGMQYMHNMYAGAAKFSSLDNGRYPMIWTHASDVISQHLLSSNKRS